MAQKIKLAIVTPQQILFEDVVTHIQVPARDGYMGFLSRHAPLVSPLGIGLLELTDLSGKDHYFAICGGYFEIHSDKMVILADVAEPAETIDAQRAEKARERAKTRISGDSSGNWDIQRAEAALKRALNRLHAVDIIK